MGNDYYLQQINNKLEIIQSNSNQITTYLPNMSKYLYFTIAIYCNV